MSRQEVLNKASAIVGKLVRPALLERAIDLGHVELPTQRMGMYRIFEEKHVGQLVEHVRKHSRLLEPRKAKA